jgi:DNA polymerase III delta subunit
MKVSAEKFIDKPDQYKFEKTIFFVSGNEDGLINKVKNIIISKHKSNIYSETKILDLKTDNKMDLKKLTHTQSLFNKSNILQIKNPNDSFIESLEKTNYDNNTIIIEGKNIKNNSKIKKYFDFHKKFYSIACYKLTKAFKKKTSRWVA